MNRKTARQPPDEEPTDVYGPSPARRNGTRRLIAGLRVTAEDEELLEIVRPYLPGADSAGELAYRLWRRGLESMLAELAALGVRLPPALSEDTLATMTAQRLLLCLPLLRRSGKLALLGLEAQVSITPAPLSAPVIAGDEIATAAAEAIMGLGGDAFL
jgi:hypothetical protein